MPETSFRAPRIAGPASPFQRQDLHEPALAHATSEAPIMDAASPRRTVPQIPSLVGEENFDDWLSVLEEHLEAYDLADLVFEDAFYLGRRRKLAEAQKFRDDKVFVLGIIQTTVTQVAAQLEEAGWDFDNRDQHPRTLYQLIERTFKPVPLLKARRIARCLRQLNVKPGNITLREFKATIEAAKQSLKDDGASISDVLAVWAVLDALELEYPEWHHGLLREKYSNKLSWNQLLEHIATKAREDEEDLDENGGNVIVVV